MKTMTLLAASLISLPALAEAPWGNADQIGRAHV